MASEERHERLLEAVQAARAKFEERQDSVQNAKDEYYEAVRRLHEAGMPLRDVASKLGLSHQRVHQMMSESSGEKRGRLARAKKAAGPAGAILLTLLLAGAAWLWSGSTGNEDADPVATNTERVAESPTEGRAGKGDKGLDFRFKGPGWTITEAVDVAVKWPKFDLEFHRLPTVCMERDGNVVCDASLRPTVEWYIKK